jgi:hypothetical protein
VQAIYAESNLILLRETIFTLVGAGLSAWFICLILLPSFTLTFIVMGNVSLIIFGVMGYLHWWVTFKKKNI